MTDEHDDQRTQPGVYDDDRLLAFALGLDDDPELLTAAAADPRLAERLEAMRADVAAVGAQVAAAVPEPEEEYTDLSGERWSGLQEFFTPPAAAEPRRRRRWLRVLVPVTALVVLAVVAGVVALNGGLTGGSAGPSSSSMAAGSAADNGGGTSGKSSTERTPAAPAAFGERFADEISQFAVIVLARARNATGVVQRFAVLRIFKGSAPKVVELVVDDHPADRGRLHLLMLEPTAPPVAQTASPLPDASIGVSASPAPSPASSPAESPGASGSSPAPIPSLAATGPGQELAVSYTYEGQPTVVREFAAGTDPSSVSITVP